MPVKSLTLERGIMPNKLGLILMPILFIIGGCVKDVNPPLLFGQTQTLGVTINGTAATQGAELTVGYRDYDIAVVPTTVTQGTGQVTQIKATAGTDYTDGLSVIGQFEANAKSSSPEVSLGKFFATGLAAKVLADGFN